MSEKSSKPEQATKRDAGRFQRPLAQLCCVNADCADSGKQDAGKERSRNNSITLVLQGAASRLSSRELATHLASWNWELSKLYLDSS